MKTAELKTTVFRWGGIKQLTYSLSGFSNTILWKIPTNFSGSSIFGEWAEPGNVKNSFFGASNASNIFLQEPRKPDNHKLPG